jgi:hypothetical protein
MLKKEPTVEEPSDFKWVGLKKKFDTEPEARQYLKDNFDRIVPLNLYQMEED